LRMTSRYPMQGDKEQNQIQAQFDVSRAKDAISELKERIESLRAIGKMTDKDSKELLKLLKTVQDKIGKVGKK